MSLDMAYDGNKGGITTKTDVGTLLYNVSGKPYALSNVNPSTGIIPSTLDSLTYTSFESVSTISEGNYTASFVYNPENERAKMEIKQNGNTILTRWYLGSSYIKETASGVTKEYTFIGGDAYSAPVVAIKQSGNSTMYYLLRDHLRSITHIVNASNGTTLYEYSYDAWGRMRSTTNWTDYAPGSEPVLFVAGRGFTGHENLPWFSMINMNGRIYDPLTGQFLSPDNNVQSTDNTQNFNRYGYCLNNPLIYTDESGEIWNLIIGGLIGGTFNWITHGCKFNAKGLGYFGVGALAGALGAGVGAGISSTMAGGSFGAGFVGSSAAMTATTSFTTGAAIGGGAGFSAGFTNGFGNGLMQGQNFGEALWSGTKNGLIGGASGAAIGGLVNGIDAAADGRNFWHGGTKTIDASLQIPQVNQAGQYDCNYACAESVDGYYGNGRNQGYFQTLEPGNGQGLTDVEIGRMYGKAGYGARQISINTTNPASTAGDIANTMSANKAVVLNYNTGVSGGANSAGLRIVFGHATVVTRVRIFDNGRFIINVMNPSSGSSRFTNVRLFHLIFGVY